MEPTLVPLPCAELSHHNIFARYVGCEHISTLTNRLLTRIAWEDGEREHRRDVAYEVDTARGVHDAYGEHKIAEMRGILKTRRRNGSRGEVLPGQPRSYRHRNQTVADCSSRCGGMVQNGKQMAGVSRRTGSRQREPGLHHSMQKYTQT